MNTTITTIPEHQNPELQASIAKLVGILIHQCGMDLEDACFKAAKANGMSTKYVRLCYTNNNN